MKWNPALAGYLVAITATVIGAYIIKQWIENGAGYVGNKLDQISKDLDEAATDYGTQTAVASSSNVSVIYAKARSDWAKATGTDINKAIGGFTIWPTLDSWIDGFGPKGYTYGSPNYPKPKSPSMFTALSNAF